MVEATGLWCCSAMTGLCIQKGREGKTTGFQIPVTTSWNAFCHCAPEREALSHPHSRVWVPPVAANRKHCLSQQAPTQACFMLRILWQWQPNLMSYFGTSNRWQCVCSPFSASCSHVTSRENRMRLFVSFLRLICLGESVPFLAQLK